MASSLDPRIIVLALGAGALGFPDALRVLLDVAGRSPLTDIAICVFAIAVVTAQALGAMLLARFVRKAQRAGGDAPGAPPRRTDLFAQMTLVLSLGVAFLVSACLLVDAGASAGGLGLLHLVGADIARKMKSPVAIAALATGAAALPCARPLLRIFRREEEDRSRPAGTARFASMTQATSFTAGAAAFFLVAASGGVYARHGFLVGVGTVVVGIGTALLVVRSTFARTARNAAGAGGRVASAPAADTRRFGGRMTRLAVVAFAALLCCLVVATFAPLESEADGVKDP